MNHNLILKFIMGCDSDRSGANTASTLSDNSDVDLEVNNHPLLASAEAIEVNVFDIDESDERNETRSWQEGCIFASKRILHTNLFPDDCRFIGNFQLFDSIEAFRVCKFIMTTVWAIIIMHVLVRLVDWEHDTKYSIEGFFYFDFGHVVLDCIAFAIVGRVYKRRGVDRLLPFFLPMMVSCVYGSWSTDIWFLRNSITLYNLACTWSWQLYLYAAACCIAIVTIMGLHIRCSIRDGSYLYRFVEMTLVALVFIAPAANNPSMHLHHYYSFWLLGMFFNREEWWSQMAMAICWGQYINGVSVWGRDSILTCAYSNHVAIGNGCDSGACSRLLQATNTNYTDVASDGLLDWLQVANTSISDASPSSASLDWRNCNA